MYVPIRYLTTRIILLAVTLTVITGCQTLSLRTTTTETLARDNGFVKQTYHTSQFTIVSYQKRNMETASATLFIEGDGRAWINKRRISKNPSPANPVAFKLAISDSSDHIIYLGRPCQYVDLDEELHCTPDYWTSKRASEEVVTSMSTVIDQIKKEYSLNNIRLVGYSGGGTIAALIAARRDDVTDLRTVAGNLDLKAFTDYHEVTPLTGSLNPVDFADKLSNLPQKHYLSEKDSIIVPGIINDYIRLIKSASDINNCIFTETNSFATHNNGWQQIWMNSDQSTLSCITL